MICPGKDVVYGFIFCCCAAPAIRTLRPVNDGVGLVVVLEFWDSLDFMWGRCGWY